MIKMKAREYDQARFAIIQKTLTAVGLCLMLFAIGCGGGSHNASSAEKYPAGISEDVEQQLKYDARVDGVEPEGENLIVNVNESWMHSPPGMRERALGHWYSLWKPTGKASKIVIKYEGNEVESWTGEKGYQPKAAESKEESAG